MSLQIYWFEFHKANGVEDILALQRVSIKGLEKIASDDESPELSGEVLNTILGVLRADYEIEFPKLPRRLEIPLLKFWKKGCDTVQGGPEAEIMALQLAGITDIAAFTQKYLDYTQSGEGLEETQAVVTETLNWLRDRLEGLHPGKFGMLGIA
ncbi:MAG: hypothetical protein ACAI35_20160 [Candidatus Methylacidiphilales bacterium]|nr:hypothetical protein [Candidatus Methylacidiphilales bacterium]